MDNYIYCPQNSSKIACMGLSFKVNIDDLRESPSLQIVQQLVQEQVGELLIVEPHIHVLPNEMIGHSTVCLVGMNTALEQADIVLGLVDHEEFKQIDRDLLKEKIVIDLRGMWR